MNPIIAIRLWSLIFRLNIFFVTFETMKATIKTMIVNSRFGICLFQSIID